MLVTGAAGGVAGLLLPGLRPAFGLRLTDRADGPETVGGDLGDAGFAREVCARADAIVHLAGNPDPNTRWPGLREPNGDVLVNVLEAAAAAGVRRVVLASSLHAMGGHVDAGATDVAEDAPPYPCCAYGAMKVFAENMGRLFSEQHGLSVVCLRLGGVRDRPLARSWLHSWLSGPDLVRLVTAALTADVRFGVYHGVSANTDRRWSRDRARTELGYQPRDDAAAHAAGLPDDITGAPRRNLHLT